LFSASERVQFGCANVVLEHEGDTEKVEDADSRVKIENKTEDFKNRHWICLINQKEVPTINFRI
jgi:hypothetical protein